VTHFILFTVTRFIPYTGQAN